jgi:predicted peptidase
MRRLLTSIIMATLVILWAVVLAGCNGASERARLAINKDGDKGFKYAKISRGWHHRKYAYFIPLAYNPANRYPVIIFLHGQGEGAGIGEGDGKQLTVGLGPFVGLQRDTFPFICIFPQSDGKWNPDSEYAQDVIAALDDVSSRYSVDADRVYLTGLSTGGYGSYAIAARYPDRFAAIVPMGSNNAPKEDAGKLMKIAVRAYCSEKGDSIAGTNDRDMVSRLKSLGGRAEFLETPTSGHNCWDYVYGQSNMFDWLRRQRRSLATPGR